MARFAAFQMGNSTIATKLKNRFNNSTEKVENRVILSKLYDHRAETILERSQPTVAAAIGPCAPETLTAVAVCIS